MIDENNLSFIDEDLSEVSNLSNKDFRYFESWSCLDVKNWIECLHFLSFTLNNVPNILFNNKIDGFCFLELEKNDFIGLNFKEEIVQKLVYLQEKVKSDHKLDHSNNLASSPKKRLREPIENKNHSRYKKFDFEKIIYGQLIVLGYSEYRFALGDYYIPIGASNNKYLLKKRKMSKGAKSFDFNYSVEKNDFSYSVERNEEKTEFMKTLHNNSYSYSNSNRRIISHSQASGSNNNFVLQYTTDESKDVFQIGRAFGDENDITVKGPGHINEKFQNLSGTVSRIVCDRNPPHKCFLYACGNDSSQGELGVGATAAVIAAGISNSTTTTTPLDAFSKHGIHMWYPDLKVWKEISVQGRVYQDRRSLANASKKQQPSNLVESKDNNKNLKKDSTFTNEILDGSLIDISGVVFLFRNPNKIFNNSELYSRKIIEEFNSLCPQCPVLMQTIQFHYSSSLERKAEYMKRIQEYNINDISSFSEGGGVGGRFAVQEFHVPDSDYSEISEEKRPYVFPSCGHVHGYSVSLEGRPCPLCRTSGAFVPLSFPFESSICNKFPTHVFNPCGHVASKECCEFWSQISMPIVGNLFQDLRPACPFCRVQLSREEYQEGPPFSKLILQSDRQIKTSPLKAHIQSQPNRARNSINFATTGILDLQIHDE